MDTNAADLEAEQPANPRWVSMGRDATTSARWGAAAAPAIEATGPAPVPAYDWLGDGESASDEPPLTPVPDATVPLANKVRSGWGGRRRATQPAKRSAFSRPGDRPRPG